uniref:Solute carrier family 40 protein n=1 Tax=Onchocerca flexuosa TaxID=387005 RepID=A0A183HWJ0_9BILA
MSKQINNKQTNKQTNKQQINKQTNNNKRKSFDLFFLYIVIYAYNFLRYFSLSFASSLTWQPDDVAADVMGSIAAAMQIISLGGQIYEIFEGYFIILYF